jgi:hypothetical protein
VAGQRLKTSQPRPVSWDGRVVKLVEADILSVQLISFIIEGITATRLFIRSSFKMQKNVYIASSSR